MTLRFQRDGELPPEGSSPAGERSTPGRGWWLAAIVGLAAVSLAVVAGQDEPETEPLALVGEGEVIAVTGTGASPGYLV
ncbi:MAG: hypothetical protein KC457_35575, partial [Myxococcales bacterium]|nr:hypothetical protein [Myxococcales bacterium]